jgi:hypothetical protein
MDYKRLALNLLFFWFGILIPLLAFQSAFAETWVESSTGTSWGANRVEGTWSTENGYSIEPQTAGSVCMAYQVGDTWYKRTDKCISGAGRYVKTVETIADTYAKLFYSYDYQPSPPSHCLNKIQDEDETGIDCGGSCPDTCGELTCPDGYIAILDGTTITGCAREGAKDSFGNCGAGFFYDSSTKKCVSLNEVTSPISYGESYIPPELDPVDPFTPGQFSVTHFYSPEDVVDNQDGTETATISITSIDSDGGETFSTASVTRPLGSETGTGFGTGTDPNQLLFVAPGFEGQTDYQEDTVPEDEPGNYNYQLEEGEYDGEIATDDVPDKESLTELFNGFIANNPVASVITGSGITLDSAVTELTWVYPPTGQLVTFDLSDRNDVLSTIGILLAFLSGISAYYIIVGRQ